MSIQRINGTRGHWYKIDGRKADGVTTLISKGLPKPALMYWSARSVAEYVADNLADVADMTGMSRAAVVAKLKQVPWSQRKEAAAKGTEVHALAERLIRGDEVEVPEHLAGHVESCVRFLDDWKVAPQLVEATVANRQWRYCGTLDVLDEQGRLFDYKTARSGIWPETALQLAAYANADVYLDGDGEHPMPEVTGGFGVWIRADGYDVYRLDISEPVYKAFLHVAYVARQAMQMDAWKSEALEVPA